MENLQRRIKRKGDGEIGSPAFRWLGPLGLKLEAFDANEHHLTYGVLAAALQAVENWMSSPGQYHQFAKFDIVDGDNQVGVGYISSVNLGG